MKNSKWCETIKNNIECGRRAKYLLKDIICEDKTPFPVCAKCFKSFIIKDEKKPHYKKIRELK